MENFVLIICVLLTFACGFLAVNVIYPTPKKQKRNRKRRKR